MRQVLSLAVCAILAGVSYAQDDWDKPSLGFQYMDVEDFAPMLENTKAKLPVKAGVVIVDVAPNGPAAGKLNRFDIILKIDQTPIKSGEDLKQALASIKIGDTPVINGRGHFQQNGVSKWKTANTKLGPAKTKRQIFVDALEVSIDSVTDQKIYRHPSTPEHIAETTNLSLVISEDKGTKHLLIRMTVKGNLVFVKKLVFKIDGKTHEMPVDASSDIGERVEWDMLPAENHKELLNALLTTTHGVTVRYSGFQEFKDRELTLEEIYAMRGVYQAFLAMGGKAL